MATVRKRKWSHNGVEKEAWVVSYTDQGGKRRLKTFDKKKEADAYRTRVEVEIESGEHVAPTASATVRQVCEHFMKYMDQKHKDNLVGLNCVKFYDQQIRIHIVPHIGAKIFSSLTPHDAYLWYENITKAGAAKSSRGHYLSLFRLIEDFAVKRGYTKKKVMREFRPGRNAHRTEVIKTFDVDQIGAIFKALETRATVADRKPGTQSQTRRGHALLKCAVYLSAICGLRRGEIFGLTRAAVDFEHGIIRVRSAMTAFNELKGPKTRAGIRDVPMPTIVQSVLHEYIETYSIKNDRDLVFTARSGKAVCFTSTFHQLWRGLLAKAGIQDLENVGYHFHALRHFAASWAMEMGMSPPDVANLLGHKTFDMTLQVYAHPVNREHHRHATFQRNASALLDATRPQHDGITI